MKNFSATVFFIIFLTLLSLHGCANINLHDKTTSLVKNRGVAATPAKQNPFGMGVAYVVDFINQDLNDPQVVTALEQSRERQLQQALFLSGPGGAVRIWCPIRPNLLTECQEAIKRAYELDLVPTINTFFRPSAATGNDPSVIPSPQKDFGQAASILANWVSKLPTVPGHILYLEITNEPNFTDGWFSGTVDYEVRAREIAQYVAQASDAIHALGNPLIKVSMGALSPVSDSQPPSDPNNPCQCFKNIHGHCTRGNLLNRPAIDFVKVMVQERPDLFGPYPKVDFWAAHPYTTEHFNTAASTCQLNTCPIPTEDQMISEYQEDLKAAGLPKDFPIQLTELGYGIRANQPIPSGFTLASAQQFAADFICSHSNTGAYPQVWLKKGDYNNVTATMGFVLPLSNPPSYLNWLDISTPVTEMLPFQKPLPIYNQVRNCRIQMGF